MVAVRELIDSRGSVKSPPSETRRYVITGTTDEVYGQALADVLFPGAVLTHYGVLYQHNVELDWEGRYATAVVTYGKGEKKTGSMRWSFDTTGGTVNVKASLSTVASYPEGVDSHGGAIGVHGDEVDGCEVVIPAGKLTVSYSHPSGFITIARVKQLMRATGIVNSDPFMTFAPGEVLFLGATGSDGSDSDAEVTYQFAVSENLQNHVIGEIEGITKAGWDYAWVEFQDDVGAQGGAVKKPKAVHVEQVYRRTSLSALVGFG